MQRIRPASLSLLFAAAALAFSTLFLSACDTFTHGDAPSTVEQQALVHSARTWFDTQTAALAKSGDDALRRFYPDWDKGTTVTTDEGRQAVVTTLWRDYTVRYDSSLYFLRTLAVLLGEGGEVTGGHIVEFSSRDSIAYTDGPLLVRQWMEGNFGARTISVIERSATYAFEQGFLHLPDREPVGLTLEVKPCETALGKVMATEQCEVVGYWYDYTICSAYGGVETCTDFYSTEYQCWLEGDTGGGGPGGAGGDGGSDGGGSGPGGGDPGYSEPPPDSPADVLENLVKVEPLLLLEDVPCDEIPQWEAIAERDVPTVSITRAQQMGVSFEQQHIADAHGAVVNMDRFGIRLTQLPIQNGQRMTASQFIEHIRRNINGFIDTNNSDFTHFNSTMQNAWMNGDPNGTVLHVNIKLGGVNMDDGSVLTNGHTQSGWFFTTVFTTWDQNHPVSGHRYFGIEQNADGSYTVFTRGVDRLTTSIDHYFQELTGIPFSSADALWESFQAGVSSFANQNGGSATMLAPVTHRPDWDKVRDVLTDKTTPYVFENCQW